MLSEVRDHMDLDSHGKAIQHGSMPNTHRWGVSLAMHVKGTLTHDQEARYDRARLPLERQMSA